MTSTAYSTLKIFHHQPCLDTLRRGDCPTPLFVHLVPTNRCNHSCLGCAYRVKGYPANQLFQPQDEIPWTKLAEIVSDCEAMGVRAILLTGGGEPTMHPKFLDLCQLILDAEIDLAVTTNGSRWSPEHTTVVGYRAEWVRFSLDAGSSSTYAKYHNTSSEEYDNARASIRLLTKQLSRRPVVGISFVVNNYNWPDIVVATQRAQEDGADNIRLSALMQPAGAMYFYNFYDRASALCKEAEELSTSTFQVFNLFGARLQDLKDASPDYADCNYSRLVTYLGADCNLYQCCNNAYNNRGLLGSFKDQSFRSLWQSEEVRQHFENFDAQTCSHCTYNDRNRAIAYAVESRPEHVNFI